MIQLHNVTTIRDKYKYLKIDDDAMQYAYPHNIIQNNIVLYKWGVIHYNAQLQSTVEKVESIKQTIAEDITDRCNCEFTLSQAGIQCILGDQHSVAFRATLETTSPIQSINENIQSWVEGNTPINIHNRSLSIDHKYPVGIINPKSLTKKSGGSETLMNRIGHMFSTT